MTNSTDRKGCEKCLVGSAGGIQFWHAKDCNCPCHQSDKGEKPPYCRCTESSVAHLRGCYEGWGEKQKPPLKDGSGCVQASTSNASTLPQDDWRGDRERVIEIIHNCDKDTVDCKRCNKELDSLIEAAKKRVIERVRIIDDEWKDELREEGKRSVLESLKVGVEGLKVKESPYVKNQIMPDNSRTTMTNIYRQSHNAALNAVIELLDKEDL